MNLLKVKMELTNAVESIHAANAAIDYFGGLGDTVAMRQIYNQLRHVRIALAAFDKKHGDTL